MRELYSLVMATPPAQPLDAPDGSSAPSSSSPGAHTSRLSASYFSPSSPRPTSSPSSASSSSSPNHAASTPLASGLGPSGRTLQVHAHGTFLETWGETDMTATRDGSNPMVEAYENAKFVCN